MSIALKPANESDIDQAAAVDNQSWPRPMWTTREQFMARFDAFPRGFIVADSGGRVGGLITSLRTRRKWVMEARPPWQTSTA